jgi:hypothetical protein
MCVLVIMNVYGKHILMLTSLMLHSGEEQNTIMCMCSNGEKFTARSFIKICLSLNLLQQREEFTVYKPTKFTKIPHLLFIHQPLHMFRSF